MIQFRSAGTWHDLDMINLQSMSKETWHRQEVSLNQFKDNRGDFRNDVLVRFSPMLVGDDNIIQLDAVKIIGQQRDETAPVFSNVQNVNADALSNGGVTVTYTVPTARDAIDGIVQVFCNEPNNVVYPIGTTIVTCTADDISGNRSTATLRITVTLADVVKPVINPVEPIFDFVENTNTKIITFTTPQAFDNVDGKVPVTCDPQSGNEFSSGVTVVTCTASDSAGNVETVTFDVDLFVYDTIPPTFDVDSVPELISLPIIKFPMDFTNPTATDSTDGLIPVYCNWAPLSIIHFGDTPVHCYALDSFGNIVEKDFTLTVEKPALFDLAILNCNMTLALGETKTMSLSQCEGNHNDYYLSKIHNEPQLGTASVSEDKLSFSYTAPVTMPTQQLLDYPETFSVSMDYNYPDRPKILVSVTLME